MKTAITVGPVWSRLDAPRDVAEQVRAALSVRDPAAEHTQAYKSGRWDGSVGFVKITNDFLSGLTWRVSAAVAGATGQRPTVAWPQASLAAPLCEPMRGVDWRPYQAEAVAKALRARRLQVECPTRSGKTEMAFEWLRLVGRKTLWITHLRLLLDQTSRRLTDRLGIEPGVVAGPRRTDGPVVVGMLQTLVGLPEAYFAQFGAVVFDESHHAGSETAQDVLRRCVAADYRLAVSATARTGNPVTDLRIEGAFGPVHTVAGTMELADMGFIATPRVVALRVPPTTYPAYEQVREAVCPGWRADPKGVIGKAGGRLIRYAYDRGVVENEARNKVVVDVAVRHALRGEKFLVLCNRVPHAAALAAAVYHEWSRRAGGDPAAARVYQLDGGDDADTRAAMLAEFKREGRGGVLVATPFFREGADVPQIDAGLLAGGGESDIAVVQALGRMLTRRPDKSEVLIYDFLDGRGGHDDRYAEKDYLGRHARSRFDLYRERGFSVEGAASSKTPPKTSSA